MNDYHYNKIRDAFESAQHDKKSQMAEVLNGLTEAQREIALAKAKRIGEIERHPIKIEYDKLVAEMLDLFNLDLIAMLKEHVQKEREEKQDG